MTQARLAALRKKTPCCLISQFCWVFLRFPCPEHLSVLTWHHIGNITQKPGRCLIAQFCWVIRLRFSSQLPIQTHPQPPFPQPNMMHFLPSVWEWWSSKNPACTIMQLVPAVTRTKTQLWVWWGVFLVAHLSWDEQWSRLVSSPTWWGGHYSGVTQREKAREYRRPGAPVCCEADTGREHNLSKNWREKKQPGEKRQARHHLEGGGLSGPSLQGTTWQGRPEWSRFSMKPATAGIRRE